MGNADGLDGEFALSVVKKLAGVDGDLKSHGSREEFLAGVDGVFGFDLDIDLFIWIPKDLLGLRWSEAQVDLKDTVREGGVGKLQLGSNRISSGLLVVKTDLKMNRAFERFAILFRQPSPIG